MVNQKREVASPSSTARRLETVLLSLLKIADGGAEIVLLHAQKAHACGGAAVFRLLVRAWP